MSAACRHVGNDCGRVYELEQTAVKCMRGILFCYMKQSKKVCQRRGPARRGGQCLYAKRTWNVLRVSSVATAVSSTSYSEEQEGEV